MNNAVRNMGTQISLWDPAFYSFGYTPRSGFAGSVVNMSVDPARLTMCPAVF